MSAVRPARPPAEAPERESPAARRRRPGADRLTLAIVVLCLLGIADAGYLTYVHYSGAEGDLRLVGGGCETVQTSKWSKLAGIPVALLGLISYVAILGTLAIRGELGRAAGFGARAGRLRVQHVPHLPRAVLDPRHLPVVRGQRGADDAAGGDSPRSASCAPRRVP